MSQQYTIGQLAKAVKIPITTIRYYERIGLIEAENRSVGNYRLYDGMSLRRLKFIRAAQAIGFTLDNVRALLGEGDSTPCCGDVEQLIEDRLAEIDLRLKDLRQVQRVLKKSLAKCRSSDPHCACQVLESLKK